eukprot:CAMPEP_0170183748 /NCGR_PEP_ID=MMETSP0040_2-20121228/31597_1 /TAXON_ID=641309 /ORGANISM="Lotharella oceanica, Strain CCMP622" /LENGTH=53 /DNA_ID=CAMNT_0010429585 /DNA_START=821 /DNA_END=982 /DNA_ORIENTATION=+
MTAGSGGSKLRTKVIEAVISACNFVAAFATALLDTESTTVAGPSSGPTSGEHA